MNRFEAFCHQHKVTARQAREFLLAKAHQEARQMDVQAWVQRWRELLEHMDQQHG